MLEQAGDSRPLVSRMTGNKELLEFFSYYFLLKEQPDFLRPSDFKEFYRRGLLDASFDPRLNPPPVCSSSTANASGAVQAARMAAACHLVTTAICQCTFIITNRHLNTTHAFVSHSID